MLTRAEKQNQVAEGAKLIKGSKNLVFADFTSVPVSDIQRLKKELRDGGVRFQVIKKRLLKISLERAGVDFDPTQFESQVGTFFLSGDLTGAASKIYKFAKEIEKAKKHFKVLSAYDLEKKAVIGVEEFTAIAKLPTREVLIAMIMGGITGPLRAFMSIVKQLSEKPAVASALVKTSADKKAMAGEGGASAMPAPTAEPAVPEVAPEAPPAPAVA